MLLITAYTDRTLLPTDCMHQAWGGLDDTSPLSWLGFGKAKLMRLTLSIALFTRLQPVHADAVYQASCLGTAILSRQFYTVLHM